MGIVILASACTQQLLYGITRWLLAIVKTVPYGNSRHAYSRRTYGYRTPGVWMALSRFHSCRAGALLAWCQRYLALRQSIARAGPNNCLPFMTISP